MKRFTSPFLLVIPLLAIIVFSLDMFVSSNPSVTLRGSSQAGTPVSGVISNDTVWSLEGSPYKIEGDVTVLEGATLTVEPGVRVVFNWNYALRIQGMLMAIGNESNMIFLGLNESLWYRVGVQRLKVESTGQVTIKHCRISYLYIHLESSQGNFFSHNIFGNYSGIWMLSSRNNTISNNTFENIPDPSGSVEGIAVGLHNSSNNTISNNTISNFIDGIGLSKSFGNILSNNTIFRNAPNGIMLSSSWSNVISLNTLWSNDRGIFLWSSSENILSVNTIFSNEGEGIFLLDRSDGNTISNNTVFSNKMRGITIHSSSNNILSASTILSNRYGVILVSSPNTTVTNNNITNNGFNFGVWGDSFSDFLHHIDTSNTVNGKTIYYLINQSDIVVDPSTFPDIGYLGIVNSTRITVRQMNLSNNWEGIMLAYTMNSMIEKVNLASNVVSIFMFSSSNNTIVANTVLDSNCGVRISSSSDNALYENTISFNQESRWPNIVEPYNPEISSMDGHGIRLTSSSTNLIFSNVISSNEGDGIFLSSSFNNSIASNKISHNAGDGIHLEDSKTNIISGNHIALNGDNAYYGFPDSGLKVESSLNNSVYANTLSLNTKYGLYLFQYDLPAPSHNNTFHHNNLINNTVQVNVRAREFNNEWDDGAEGNYWSDYEGIDLNWDGVGDTLLPHHGVDYHPLMRTYAEDHKPIAFLSASPTTVVKYIENVEFDASDSYDLDGSVVSYWYDYGDGFDSGWVTEAIHYRSYSEPGEYYAKVKVKDNDGLESDWSNSVKITVVEKEYVELIEDYFPCWLFSEGEKWFPTSFYFDNNADVTDNKDNYESSQFKDSETGYPPYYAYVHIFSDENYLTIQYWLYYAFNYHPDLPDHEHDWDSTIFVVFRESDLTQPVEVRFFYHHWARIVAWDKIEKQDGTHLTAYVANGSHGAYDTPLAFEAIGAMDTWELGGLTLGVENFNWYWIDKITDDVDVPGRPDLSKRDRMKVHWLQGTSQFESESGEYYWPDSWPSFLDLADDSPWDRDEWNNTRPERSFLGVRYHTLVRVQSATFEEVVEGVASNVDGYWYSTPQTFWLSEGTHRFETTKFQFVDSRFLMFDHWEDENQAIVTKQPIFFYPLEIDNNFTAIFKVLLSGTVVELQELEGKLYLHIYDSSGRHIGFNYEQNQTEINISGAYYYDFLNSTFVVVPPEVSEFRIVVDATYAEYEMENFNITITTIKDALITDQRSVQYSISKASKQDFKVMISEGKIDITSYKPETLLFYVLGAGIAIGIAITTVLFVKTRKVKPSHLAVSNFFS